MDKKVRYIKKDPGGNGFEDDMMPDHEDSLLFENIGDYMKVQSDLDDVQNDPGLYNMREAVRGMVSEYNRYKLDNTEREGFISDAISGDSDKELKKEIRFIKQEIDNNKLKEITADWVREWHEKKQKIGVTAEKSEEISNFITSSINSEIEPEKVSEVPGKKTGKNVFVKYISLSAAAIIGAFIVLKTLLPSSDPGKLYDSYYKPFDAISPVTRSMNSNETDNYSSYIASYKTGDYQKASIGFAAISGKDPSSVSSRFYQGLSQLALKNYPQAIYLLAEVSAQSGEYGKEARWYLGLAYLKTDNKAKASECFEFLSRSDGYYRDRSEKILRRLK